MNAGFLEALKLDSDLDCFVFADVDLIPIHLCNIYECSKEPRHVAVHVDKFNYSYVHVKKSNTQENFVFFFFIFLGLCMMNWLEEVWLCQYDLLKN